MTTGRINQVTTDTGSRRHRSTPDRTGSLLGPSETFLIDQPAFITLEAPLSQHLMIQLHRPAIDRPLSLKGTSDQGRPAGQSTMFPVLTSSRLDLPRQNDGGSRPSMRTTSNRTTIVKSLLRSRRIPEWLVAQQVWPSASNPHPSTLQVLHHKRTAPDSTDRPQMDRVARPLPQSWHTPSAPLFSGS